MAALETHTSSAEDVSLNDAKNDTVLPLCCMLPSATGAVLILWGNPSAAPNLLVCSSYWPAVLWCWLHSTVTLLDGHFSYLIFEKELQLSRSSVSVMWSTGLFLAAMVLPRVGKILDARGQFRVVSVVTPVFALAVGSVSIINSWIMLALAFFF